jgi:integrase/recombinase XerC
VHEETELRKSLKLLSKRDRLIIRLLLDYGMRGAELRDITVQDVDIEQGLLRVGGKKGSKSREFPLPADLVSDLEGFIRDRACASQEPIFELSASGLKFIWSKVRPCKKGVHSLRHTFAVRLYERTGDIRLVQVCLGHRSINNTMIYADFVDSRAKIAKVFLQGESHAS